MKDRRNKHSCGSVLDITTVTDREEIAEAFGAATAWRVTIQRIKTKEAKETNPSAKRKLRLLLLNAETQLQLCS